MTNQTACREQWEAAFKEYAAETELKIREYHSHLFGWMAACEWMNTRPTDVASHAEGDVDDPKTDREALVYLMRAFDTESWQCPQCGHDDDCATMDSAYFLRDYLRDHPPRSGDEARDAARYRFIKSLAGGEPQEFSLVEDAAFASHHGCEHNFDFNIDAAMAARGGE